jgi:hypothetical protein
MDEVFVNKVADSGIVTLNLEDYYPKEPIVVFDMKDYLFMGLILKEKDFREALKQLDLTQFENKIVALTCSADAVIPVWAYMLAASAIEPVAADIIFGTEEDATKNILVKNISKIVAEDFLDKRVVVKGCGELPVTESAYVEITRQLRPVAKSIMYGEPCSTVPVYKKPLQRP